jgi:hypothetical protein
LREKLETSSTQELDHSLVARHQNLKDWFKAYQKTKSLDQELSENINEASEELISQDQTISNLRTENNKLKQSNQSLTQDLKLAQRLAQLRKFPEPENIWPTFPSWGLFSLALTFIALWIWTQKNYD